MLSFDKDRYIKIQSGAVSIAGHVRPLLRKLLSEGVERLYFMGTGGGLWRSHNKHGYEIDLICYVRSISYGQ